LQEGSFASGAAAFFGVVMSKKLIIIIGGGIAGLSAGCYGQMNGFKTRIFEMHKKKPGGLCTSWKRQGYTINGCLHWLVGTGPASNLHAIWNELGALEQKTIVDYEEYGRFESVDGRQFIIYTDIDRLKRHMKELAPEDGPAIDEFIADLRLCTRFNPPADKAPEVMNLLDFVKMTVQNLPMLLKFRKWNKITLVEYRKRFRNPLIRNAFSQLFMPDFPVTSIFMTLAWMRNKTAGYLIGGSLPFSQSIEKRYLALGGEMNYKARAVKILTENSRAVGIRLDDDSEHRADYVISAADGHTTIFDLLDGRYADDTIRGYYENLIPFPPLVHVALGVKRTFKETPSAVGRLLELPETFEVGGVPQKYLGFQIYNFDPTLAPEGKTTIVVRIPTEYEYWARLRENDEAYKAEKEKIADRIVAILDKRFPGLASDVEMRDVASPTTFVRYTGNWKGSYEGWQVTPSTWRFGKIMKKTLPGLSNFYMAGHWVEPGGGLPPAAMSGRNAIQMICKREKKTFVTVK
jgi:phytoene dehydrogenase-like protein